jgi:hypothetical protein
VLYKGFEPETSQQEGDAVPAEGLIEERKIDGT